MSDVTYSIKEVSEICGWSIHMLRYYEKEGLLPTIGRDDNGYRTYTDRDLGLIEFINRLRTTGMPVSQMRTYVQLSFGRNQQPDAILPQLIDMLKEHRETVLVNLDILQQNIEAIEYKIDLYSNELKECLNREDSQTT